MFVFAGISAHSAAWHDLVGQTAERGPGGVLKKVWVVTNGAEVYRNSDRSSVDVRLSQHAKAYHFGAFEGDLIAIGDKPVKSDCANFGFVRSADVIVWDTDQALRFVGKGQDANVELFRDEKLIDKIGEATVEGPSDPTVMPFPIFRKTNDGRSFEIAFIYTAASGADTYEERIQESLRKVVTKDIANIDVAFVMDVTGSMHNELDAAKGKVRELMEEFSSRSVELFGRKQPIRLRFAFVGYRDRKEGEEWLELIPFASRGETDAFEEQLSRVQAFSRLNNDWPESVCAGLREAMSLDWKKENAKVILLIGDAPPLDESLWSDVHQQCVDRFIRIYGVVIDSQGGAAGRGIGPATGTWGAFKKMTVATGGQCFQIEDVEDTRTVDMIIEALKIEETTVAQAPEVVLSWAEAGTRLSRDAQEFAFRGILPDDDQRPIPPTVYVSSRRDDSRQVCLYKSKASLYEMLGDMQTDFVGMIEDPSAELLAAINAGGVEIIAELDPGVLESILTMNDLSEASIEIRHMLEVMPELPGVIRELNEKGLASEWHRLARKTGDLARFVSDPRNFYEDHAWVPFDVLEFDVEE